MNHTTVHKGTDNTTRSIVSWVQILKTNRGSVLHVHDTRHCSAGRGLSIQRKSLKGVRKTCITAWGRVHPQKLIFHQLHDKSHSFYSIQKPLAVFTPASWLSLSWARSIQSTPPSISLTCVLILSSHLSLGFQRCLFPSGSPIKTCMHFSSSHTIACSVRLIPFYLIIKIFV